MTLNLKLCASPVKVRLVPGKNRGRVEVMHSNIWGTICDDSFGTLDGRVICKMLGFQSVVSTFTATPGKQACSAYFSVEDLNSPFLGPYGSSG